MAKSSFTFVWRIGNFRYYWQKDRAVEILSPEFLININGRTKWRLRISDRYPGQNHFIKKASKCVKFYLHRTDSYELDSVSYDIQISFVKYDRSVLSDEEQCKTFYKSGKYAEVSYNAILFSKMCELFPDDDLIIRCRISADTNGLNLIEEQCFACTLLAVERISFVAVVEEFRDLIPGLKRTVRIKTTPTEKPTFPMFVRLLDKGKVKINIPINNDYFNICFFKAFVLDSSGNWQKCGQDSEWREVGEISEFTLTFDFKTLVKKQQYLQNNALTLKCEVIYSTEAEPEKIETLKYGMDYSETFQQLTPCVKNPQVTESEKPSLKTLTTVIDDLLSLFKEGTLCDTKLRTETEMFPAHKAVLSARSPVFKKMFTTDMREKNNDYVDVSDLDADIVRKFLVFIYTDTLDAMDWQTAKELYFAGDKYDVGSLKIKCSEFLKLNIRPCNCCELLVLSDMHQDGNLKSFVQDYITARDQEMFGSEEWRTFVKNHVQLAADTMCFKYTKK